MRPVVRIVVVDVGIAATWWGTSRRIRSAEPPNAVPPQAAVGVFVGGGGDSVSERRTERNFGGLLLVLGIALAALEAAGRARWRRQAIEWLHADLDSRKKTSDAKTARSTLEHWKQDADLAGLRDEAELAKAPAEDREACRAPWRDVDAAIAERAGPK